MKQITINIPDNCELKQDGNTYTIIEKEKKITYEGIAKELFKGKTCFYIDIDGEIEEASKLDLDDAEQFNNCTSEKQAEKLLAINKLMNVAKYLNGDWQPDWDYRHQKKYYISLGHTANNLQIDYTASFQYCNIYFRLKELAEKAIEILGEDTIKLALCTDY